MFGATDQQAPPFDRHLAQSLTVEGEKNLWRADLVCIVIRFGIPGIDLGKFWQRRPFNLLGLDGAIFSLCQCKDCQTIEDSGPAACGVVEFITDVVREHIFGIETATGPQLRVQVIGSFVLGERSQDKGVGHALRNAIHRRRVHDRGHRLVAGQHQSQHVMLPDPQLGQLAQDAQCTRVHCMRVFDNQERWLS